MIIEWRRIIIFMNYLFIEYAEHSGKRSHQSLKNSFQNQKSFIWSHKLDSSRSITANIAEGFGRFHHQENIQFCRNSRGSLDETLDHIITAYDDKYITKEIVTEVNKDYKDCLKEINSYIKYLKTAKNESRNN